jgi:hypothetical protein
MSAIILLICLIVGVVLRLAVFPGAYSPMETDETGYLSDGLLLVEGENSIHKYAPSGPLTWFSAGYAAVKTVATMAGNGSDIANFPGLLKPVAALESTLFHLYADLSTLRLVTVALIVLLSLAAVVAMCRFGQRMSGMAGALAAGLMAASLPTFRELGVQTRPYSVAWSLALLAIAATAAKTSRGQIWGAGILIGLAVSSHIDMVRIGPLILLLLWRNSPNGAIPWRAFAQVIGIAAVAFLLAAPWYLLHLIDNLRQIITVRVLTAEDAGSLAALRIWNNGGIAIAMLVTLAGFAVTGLERRWADLACGVWLAINIAVASHPSTHGLHHDGALLVMIVALAPLALAAFERNFRFARGQCAVIAIAIVAAASSLWSGSVFALTARGGLLSDDSVAWIEKNVPAGARVFTVGNHAKVLLPTPAAADRLWADVVAPDAWIAKYVHDTERFASGGMRPLRVMSSDRTGSDRGNRRRFHMLGAPLEPARPRYDLWLVSLGSFYDVTPAAAVEQLCKEGGVLLQYGQPMAGLPAAAAQWIRPEGNSTYIYKVEPGGCPRGK